MTSSDLTLIGSYDYRLVALSVLIAVMAAYAALDLAERVTYSRGRLRLAWEASGALALGIGISSMHYVGMLAFTLPIPVKYDGPTVALSLLTGIFASGVALVIVGRGNMGWLQVSAGSILMGGGISALHYIAMESMRFPAMCRYSPPLVILSVLLAIAFSLMSLRLTFSFREGAASRRLRQAASALLMGAAIVAMHYTGMAAASFESTDSLPDLSHAVSISALGIAGIGVVSLMIIEVALLTSLADRIQTQRALLDELFEQAPLAVHFQASLIDQIRNAVIAIDLEHNVILWNSFAETLYQWKAEEALGRNVLDLIVSDESRSAGEETVSSLEKTGNWEGEFVVRRKDGTTFPAYVYDSAIEATSREIIGFVGVSADITERKAVEEALREAQTRLESVLASVADVHVLFDQQGHSVYVNEAAIRAIGRPREEILGRTLWELYPDIVGTELDRQYRLAMDERIPVAFDFHYATTDTWWENRFYPAPEGLAVFATEITGRKRAQDELRKQKEIFQRVFDHIPVMICFLDEDSRIKLVNRELERTLGWSQEEMQQQEVNIISQLYPDPRECQRALRFVAESTGEWSDFKTSVKDGRVIDTTWAVVRLSDGTRIGIGRNITGRKQADEALSATSEQLRALSASLQSAREEEGTRIARELHDELGSALTSLKWDLEGIDKLCSEAGAQTDNSTLRKKIGGMIGLVEATMNTVTRISSELRPSILDDLGLSAAIQWQCREFEAHTGIICHPASVADHIELNREEATAVFRIVQEAMTNILRHAKATRIDITMEEEDGQFVLRVRDNGRGITEEDMTGTRTLGLIGMRERAHLVGGKIEITGAPGKGTVLTVRIPIHSRGSE